MADLPEQETYPSGVYQLEKTDPVSGGSEINETTKQGISNLPLLHLANRTKWLKENTVPKADLVDSLTDTTAGRVPTVGWMGLGTEDAPESGNSPDIRVNGFYRVPTGAAGFPSDGEAVLIVAGRSTDTVDRQFEIWGLANDVTPTQRIAFRSGDPTVVTDFTEIYHEKNIVGTVSVDGSGNVTGAAQQEGSGVNGIYWRYANGMQICKFRATFTVDITRAQGSVFDSEFGVFWTYPAVFASRPSIAATISDGGGAESAVFGAKSASPAAASTQLTIFSGVSEAGVTIRVDLTATGSWK